MALIDSKRIEIILNFRKRSDSQQGYVAVEMHNGIQECSWGEVRYRFQSSGGEDGGFQFNSFKELEERLEILNNKTRKEIIW